MAKNSSPSAEILAGMRQIYQQVKSGLSLGTGKIKLGLQWANRRIIKPAALTGLNILGYLADKVLFGSPALRQSLGSGLWSNEPPRSWHDLATTNAGWNIYSSTHSIIDNILGVLGGFIGLSNIANHALTSLAHNLASVYHLLGHHGVFGHRNPYSDKRPLATRIIFGIIAFPPLIILATMTNLVDFTLTVLKHYFASIMTNLKPFANLLGEQGVFGKRLNYRDPRPLAIRIIFGIITAPCVIGIAIISNTLDAIFTGLYHLGASYIHNVKKTFNLLGKYGVFGAHSTDKDERSLAIRIVFGILTAPAVLVSSLITNTLDLFCSYFKNWQHTIKAPAVLATGVTLFIITAPPAFLIRKTVQGFNNVFIRPIQDARSEQAFNAGRLVKGMAMLLTLGIFSIFFKLGKMALGYSSRFGAKNKPVIDVLESQFRTAIELAKNGKFEDAQGERIDELGIARNPLRTAYGARHSAEIVLKQMHDKYRAEKKTSGDAINPHTFFTSVSYQNIKNSIEDQEVMSAVDFYFTKSI